MISGDWKIVNGAYNMKTLAYDGWWTNDPYHVEAPNGTALPVDAGGCQDVLLFNITADPTERNNVALAHPEVVARLQARMAWYADPANGYKAQQKNFPHAAALPPLHNGTWAPWRK